MGYGAAYGEALGTNWATSGKSRDADIGPPIFSRCYTTNGAKTSSLYVRDPDARESTTTFAVNVVALGTVVDISSGGSWPVWQNNTTYGLAAGGNYSARGPIVLDGLHGVRIIKTGSGADPIVADFTPDSRGYSTGYTVTNRSSDCVLVNIDYAKWSSGLVGDSYCGSYGGRCRHIGQGLTDNAGLGYYFDESVRNALPIAASNIRATRGWFIVNGGPIDGNATIPNYCLLGGGRSVNFAGTVFARTTGDAGGNPIRAYMESTVLRHVQIYSTTTTFGWLKGSLRTLVASSYPNETWPDDDTYGDYTVSRARYVHPSLGDAYIGSRAVGPNFFWVQRGTFGGPGSVVPTFIGGIGPQNDIAPNAPINVSGVDYWTTSDNSGGGYEGTNVGGIEDSVLTYNTSGTSNMSGGNMSARNNKQLNGSEWQYTLNSNPNRSSPSLQGPYITTARPVPSALSSL